MSRIAAALLLVAPSAFSAQSSLLHASFDLSRELCQDLNQAFALGYRQETGQQVRIYQSHAGSAKQARAVLEGLPADVLSLNVPLDLDVVAAQSDLVAPDWRGRFPWGASPCSSAVVFLVRRGNPLLISDWPDLVRRKRALVVPHPKTSGNGRYAYLAALAFASQQRGGSDEVRSFLRSLYANVPILEGGGRSATMTFMHRNIGDVLITLEAEALQVVSENPGRFELVRPSRSIEVEVVVAVVDPVARRRGSGALAERYLGYLFTEPGQDLLARHFYRPRSQALGAALAERFPEVILMKVEELCGSWQRAHAEHFAEGALFDRIMSSLR